LLEVPHTKFAIQQRQITFKVPTKVAYDQSLCNDRLLKHANYAEENPPENAGFHKWRKYGFISEESLGIPNHDTQTSNSLVTTPPWNYRTLKHSALKDRSLVTRQHPNQQLQSHCTNHQTNSFSSDIPQNTMF
jgi:hypothetical protein